MRFAVLILFSLGLAHSLLADDRPRSSSGTSLEVPRPPVPPTAPAMVRKAPWIASDSRLRVEEIGPIPEELPARLALTVNRVPAFRIEGYSDAGYDTEIDVTLSVAKGSRAAPYLLVEGPVPLPGDALPGSTDARVYRGEPGGSLVARIDLPAGVYRLIPGAHVGGMPSAETVSFDVACVSLCARPEISATELLEELRRSGKLARIVTALDERIRERVRDPKLRRLITERIAEKVASHSFEGLERFPTLGPIQALPEIRPLLGLFREPQPLRDERFRGERLEDLFALPSSCHQPARPAPVPIASVEGLAYGHYPDLTLTACQVGQSNILARVLTALSRDKDSYVHYRGEAHRDPGPLMQALIDAGHRIEVRNERTYANFIALSYEGRNVRWPAWINTGIDLASGRLDVPMGHSQHAWRISGPLVNARVMFFMGSEGMGFFPQTDTRPEWTGYSMKLRSSSDVGGSAYLVEAADIAASFTRRVVREAAENRFTALPDGYLNAGVCNDSNAVVEIGTEKALYGEAFLSVYPLVRPAALNVAPEYNKLDDILPSLPNDAERNHATPVEDTLCRILAMSPHGVGSDRFPDARLAAQMMEVRGRVDERCHLFEGKPLPPPRVHRTASGVPVEIPTGALPRRGRLLGPGFAVPSDK